jgi:hypothetical protein
MAAGTSAPYGAAVTIAACIGVGWATAVASNHTSKTIKGTMYSTAGNAPLWQRHRHRPPARATEGERRARGAAAGPGCCVSCALPSAQPNDLPLTQLGDDA